ncbi:hypothetical protein ACGFYQ_38085 [Streptomyces sp. NPDC048258]|uniref:hypothetical protein n=1 Tax=Streptomyces sp. NPDC048258 TaxID=3365527 RepID=UPI0037138B38
MSSLPEMAGYLPAAVSALSALGAVWRLARRKPPNTTCACLTGPPAGAGGRVKRQVLRYEAADGGVLTVWTVGPVLAVAAGHKEHGLW